MPCSQVLLSHSIRPSESQTWWAKHTWRAPSGNTVRYPWLPGSQAIGGQIRDLDWFSCRTTLKLDWIGAVAHHTPSMCMFSWRSEHQMPAWSHRSGLWISLNPKHWGAVPPFVNPQFTFSLGCVPKSDQIFEFLAKLGPEPSKSMALLFCEKPYKFEGSKWQLWLSLGLKGLT